MIVVGRRKADARSFADLLATGSPELVAVSTHKDEAAFWLYSSGSTGAPKACVHLHHDMVVCAESYAKGVLGITEGDPQAQDPLPHGHVGEHATNQVRGTLGHPAASATRTEAAPLPPRFAREGHQPIQAARRTAKPREPAGQPAAAEEVAKLLAACARKVST